MLSGSYWRAGVRNACEAIGDAGVLWFRRPVMEGQIDHLIDWAML
jgi:hypothetical protein